jgi:hypothetical protein
MYEDLDMLRFHACIASNRISCLRRTRLSGAFFCGGCFVLCCSSSTSNPAIPIPSTPSFRSIPSHHPPSHQGEAFEQEDGDADHPRSQDEAPHRRQFPARAVRGGRQGRGRLPLLPPRPAPRHGRRAGRGGVRGRQRRHPLRQRPAARRLLHPARRRQGRPPPPRARGLAGHHRQKLPPPAATVAVVRSAAKGLLQVREQQQVRYGYGGDCSRYVTDSGGAACPNCHRPMTSPLEYVSPSAPGSGGFGQWVPPNASTGGAARGGFVQGVVTYTVRDDLTVTPMSAISRITLLNAFAVTDLAALQEKTVRLGYHEVIHRSMHLGPHRLLQFVQSLLFVFMCF